jgi:hypothetical protein
MIGPSFIEVEGMPIKIRTDADENPCRRDDRRWTANT